MTGKAPGKVPVTFQGLGDHEERGSRSLSRHSRRFAPRRSIKESSGNAENSFMRLLSREPGHEYLRQLREEGDLASLARYVTDPNSSRGLRRKATTYIASSKPGGGKASTGTGPTDPAIIPILAPLLEEDRDRSVRRTAAYGLRRTEDPGAERALLHALGDSDKATRIHAAMGLGDLQSRAAVDPLSELLNDPDCAATAAQSLVEIGDETALPTLRTAASSASYRRRRRKVLERAIVDLERRTGRRPSE
jgi:HEAT repeat protein